MKMKVPLLPLAGLVAFPGTEVLLSVDANSPVVDGDNVGLVHLRNDGQLSSIGGLATATEQKLGLEGFRMLSCEVTSRFRILELDEESSPTYATVTEAHEDEPATSDAAPLCDDLRQRLGDLRKLHAQVDGVDAGAAPSIDELSPTAFSLALAGIMEHENLADAQALLESTDTLARLDKLDARLSEAVKLTSTQAMLQRLGMGS